MPIGQDLGKRNGEQEARSKKQGTRNKGQETRNKRQGTRDKRQGTSFLSCFFSQENALKPVRYSKTHQVSWQICRGIVRNGRPFYKQILTGIFYAFRRILQPKTQMSNNTVTIP